MNSDLLTDAILAMAISDHDGSVQLLLPVLRQQTRDLLAERGEKDFVLGAHSLVADIAADPRYEAAFSREPESRESLPAPSRTPSPSTRALLWTMAASTMARLRELGRRCVAYATTCCRRLREIWGSSGSLALPIVDPGATCDEDLAGSEGPTIISTAARIGECGYTMELIVTCKDGFLQDASGAARGICPWCLGKHNDPGQ